ncbi:guanine nucleotide-binding protein subunit alpha, partial [Globomyces sp. JEL0801]
MCFGCFSDSEYRYIQTTNDSINSEIQQHRVQYSEEIRILLLGLSGSGKSTIFKQIALLHGGGFSTENRLAYKQSIICNIIKSMQKILNTMEQMDIPLTNSDNEIHQNYILGITNVNEQQELTRQMRLALRELWKDNGVQTCYGSFFDEVERIGFKNYTPSLKDVIHDQTETTGITEAKFRMNGQLYRLLDVGGQQSERKKWIHCFEDVTAVIFMAAISDYNKTMMYDSTKSRIHESLALFDSICNSRWFVNTSMILFLNK